jgi:heme-degrading monooxygenase HmoA
MHVRITTISGAKNIDAGLGFIKTDAVPHLQQQKGYRGITVSGNRAESTVSILTQWETQADLDASESAVEKVRGEAVDVIGGTMAVERYEQLLTVVNTPPHVGAKLHIREISMSPSKIDENLEFFKQVIVPELSGAEGFLALRNLMDRATGNGRVGTLWADESSLQAQLAKTEERRTRAADRGVTFGQDRFAEVLYANLS